MKVILNKQFGGFHPSPVAYMAYAKKCGFPLYAYKLNSFSRENKYERQDVCDPKDNWVWFFKKDFGPAFSMTEEEFDEYYFSLGSDDREDPVLIEVVEELGEDASAYVSKLVVVEIPDGLDYTVDDYDGMETLHQKVKIW